MSYENRRRGATSLAHVLDMLTRVCHDFFFFLYRFSVLGKKWVSFKRFFHFTPCQFLLTFDILKAKFEDESTSRRHACRVLRCEAAAPGDGR